MCVSVGCRVQGLGTFDLRCWACVRCGISDLRLRVSRFPSNPSIRRVPFFLIFSFNQEAPK